MTALGGGPAQAVPVTRKTLLQARTSPPQPPLRTLAVTESAPAHPAPHAATVRKATHHLRHRPCGRSNSSPRRWSHVNLDGDPAARPPVPPHVAVWRSVRVHGETKTERSRRTLGLPQVAVQALRAWSSSQAGERLAAGDGWQDTGLVFTTHRGAALDAGNVRKM